MNFECSDAGTEQQQFCLVSGWPKEIACAACMRPLNDPVLLIPCNHLSCRACISGRQCGICSQPLHKVLPSSPIIQHVSHQVLVQCARCAWLGTRMSSMQHACSVSITDQTKQLQAMLWCASAASAELHNAGGGEKEEQQLQIVPRLSDAAMSAAASMAAHFDAPVLEEVPVMPSSDAGGDDELQQQSFIGTVNSITSLPYDISLFVEGKNSDEKEKEDNESQRRRHSSFTISSTHHFKRSTLPNNLDNVFNADRRVWEDFSLSRNEFRALLIAYSQQVMPQVLSSATAAEKSCNSSSSKPPTRLTNKNKDGNFSVSRRNLVVETEEDVFDIRSRRALVAPGASLHQIRSLLLQLRYAQTGETEATFIANLICASMVPSSSSSSAKKSLRTDQQQQQQQQQERLVRFDELLTWLRFNSPRRSGTSLLQEHAQRKLGMMARREDHQDLAHVDLWLMQNAALLPRHVDDNQLDLPPPRWRYFGDFCTLQDLLEHLSHN